MAAIFLKTENVDLLHVGLDKVAEGGLNSAYHVYDNPFHAVAGEAAIDCDHSIHAAAAGRSHGHHADLWSHVHGLGCGCVAVEAEMWRPGQGWRRRAYRRCFFLDESQGFLLHRLNPQPWRLRNPNLLLNLKCDLKIWGFPKN